MNPKQSNTGWYALGSGAAVLWALTVVFGYLAYAAEQGRAWYGVLTALGLASAAAATAVARRALARLSLDRKAAARTVGAGAPIAWGGSEFLREVERRSGTKLSACFQCHKCSSGCPVGQDAEFLSSQIVRLIHLGAEREALESRAIWLCASCQACSARCPMGVDVAAVMDALRMMAVERGADGGQSRGALFGLSFLNSVQRHGRAFELGLMAAYKLRSGDLFTDVDKAPKMFSKGKLSLFPTRSPAVAEARKAFKRSASEEAKR